MNNAKKDVIVDEKTNIHQVTLREDSIQCDDDDIPLIDSQGHIEEIPVIVENMLEKQRLALKPQSLRYTGSRAGLDSPDIFHLRAPLVSCENILTPSMSQENILT